MFSVPPSCDVGLFALRFHVLSLPSAKPVRAQANSGVVLMHVAHDRRLRKTLGPLIYRAPYYMSFRAHTHFEGLELWGRDSASIAACVDYIICIASILCLEHEQHPNPSLHGLPAEQGKPSVQPLPSLNRARRSLLSLVSL